jgi:hypothetical protein
MATWARTYSRPRRARSGDGSLAGSGNHRHWRRAVTIQAREPNQMPLSLMCAMSTSLAHLNSLFFTESLLENLGGLWLSRLVGTPNVWPAALAEHYCGRAEFGASHRTRTGRRSRREHRVSAGSVKW